MHGAYNIKNKKQISYVGGINPLVLELFFF
jgi:hypothetical protein